MRKLATIQIISDISPINNADTIEVASLKDRFWKVVIKKDNFSIGQKVVYFEIDSLIPIFPETEFLVKNFYYKQENKVRLRSIRLKNQLSQGLVLPLDIGRHFNVDLNQFEAGTDISEILNVTKYEPTIDFGTDGIYLRDFPSCIRKTDEERIQNLGDQFLRTIDGVELYITVKCDGTSSTFSLIENQFDVCNRTISLKDGDNIYWHIAKKYNLQERLKKHNNYAIQGEICGPKIQKNNLDLLEPDLFVFSVIDVAKDRYLSFFDTIDFCKDIGIKMVPIFRHQFFTDELNAQNILDLAEEAVYHQRSGLNAPAEGIVVRSVYDVYSPILRSRLSFKAISNKYLLGDSSK